MKNLIRRILRFFVGENHWFAVTAILALTLIACGQGMEPTPLPAPAPTPVATCNVTINGQTVTITGPICGDGNGTVTNPTTPTPLPSPNAADCLRRGDQAYQDNVVNAWRAIVPTEPTLKGHIAALVSKLKAAQFEAMSGGLLSPDEISVKTKGGAFSETYDVWRGDLALENSAQVLYVATCTPASF
jgi:hypothetical protein